MAKNLDIDDPRYTVLRKQIIKGKPFLKKIKMSGIKVWLMSYLI